MRKLAAALIAFLAALQMAPAMAQDSGPMPEKRLVIWRDTDFYGNDLRTILDTTLDECQAICVADDGCMAFTYNTEKSVCFPKSAMTRTDAFTGAISGQFIAASPAALERASARAQDLFFLSDWDMTQARDMADNMARQHSAGGWSADDFLRAATDARNEGDLPRAFRLTGAAVTLSDASDHWAEYARLAMQLWDLGGSDRWYYRGRALGATINAYLRAGNAPTQAAALQVMAEALEIDDRGRDMIPALRLALSLQPRRDVEQMLDDAIGKYGFRIDEVLVENQAEQPRVCVRFTEPLADGGVDYEPFVRLPEGGLTVQAQGLDLCIDGLRHGQSYAVTLRQGLPAASGEVLTRSVEQDFYVRDRAPALRFPGRGYLLPATVRPALPIVAVNTTEVELTLYQVSDRNLLRAMTDDLFGRPLSYWETDAFYADMAQQIWQGTGTVATELNRDVTTLLPLDEVIGTLDPGLYVMRATLTAATATDPDESPALQWFVVSDIGLTTAQGADGLHVFARHLSDGTAMDGIEVQLISRANAVLGTATTDALGYARFDAGLAAGLGTAAPALLTAGTEADFSFLPLTDPEFDLSDRGVEGRPAAGPIDAFIATDRGAYRPGEVIHATALIRDAQVQAIDGLAVTARLTRPDGVEYLSQRSDMDLAGGHVFDLPISANVPRGSWQLDILADPDAPPLATQTLLIEDFLPERIDVTLDMEGGPFAATDRPQISIDAQYLFGAPGAGLDYEGEVRLSAGATLPDWQGYRFGRHDQTLSPRSLYDLSGITADDGTATRAVTLPRIQGADRPMTATIRVRVSEGSGRPVERQITRTVLPDGPMIGIRPAFEGGALPPDSTAGFDMIALGPDLTPQQMQVDWRLDRVETRYQWYQLYGEWNWEPITRRTPVANGSATLGDLPTGLTQQVGTGQYELIVAQPGGAGASASIAFTAGYYSADAGGTPDRLSVALDKATYAPGDTARVTLTPTAPGQALVMVMSNNLIDMQTVAVDGVTEITLPVTDAWGAGAYVTASLVTPLDAATAQTPTRALGLAYAPVDPGARLLQTSIDVADEAAPRGPMPVAIRVDGVAKGETAYVTLAAVDLGVLNISGFKAPEPADHYFGQRRLGMGLRDVYGRLIDGLSGATGAVRSGGDAQKRIVSDSPPPTEDLLAVFAGPLTVGPDGIALTQIDLPAFNGTVRLMAVAWSASGVGQASRDVLVRDPIALTASVPRFLAPGDNARALIEMTHAKGPTGEVNLLMTSDGLGLTGASASLSIAQGQTLRVPVQITAPAVGDYRLTIDIQTPGGTLLSRELTIPVRQNDPEVVRTTRLDLAPGSAFTLSADAFDGLVPGSGTATLALGPIARFDVPGLLAALDRYPYGCTEQTTSRAMPLLYLTDVASALGQGTSDDIAARVDTAIRRVLNNQSTNGAFGLWGPSSGDLWLDAYVTDFLTRADRQGYAVPDIALRTALSNLRNRVNAAPDFDEGGSDVAYALYVLAREGAAAIGDLRYYADTKAGAFTTPIGAAHLGAALAAYGDPTRADAMFRQASGLLTREDGPNWREDYGTQLRDSAAVLTLAVEAGSNAVDRTGLANRIAPTAGSPTRSTQENAWSLLAAHALLENSASTLISLDGRPLTGPLVEVIDDRLSVAPMTFRNESDTATEVTLTTFGVPDQPEPAGGTGYRIERAYYTLDGTPTDIAQVPQGTRLVAVLSVIPDRASGARLMVDDPLPAGFEIDNPNLLRGGDVSELDWLDLTNDAAFTQARTDRFLAAVDWRSDRTLRLAYIVRAVTPGSYHHPAALVSDMYRPDRRAQTDAGQVTVTAQ